MCVFTFFYKSSLCVWPCVGPIYTPDLLLSPNQIGSFQMKLSEFYTR